MARKETPASGETEQTAVRTKPGDNGFDPDQSKNFVERIINLHTELESESGRIRSEIKDVYDEAKGAGIPKKLMKAAIKKLRAKEREKSNLAELESDYPGQFEKLMTALGEYANTPLGAAAVANAGGPPGPQPRDSWNPTGDANPPQGRHAHLDL